MTPEPCPTCKGRCCRNQDFGYRVEHMGAEHYQHDCDDCCDGIKYPAQRTYEQGSAEGERRATERIVAWLRGEPERLVACDGHRHAGGKPCFVLSPMPADELADAIERGEHVGWTKREGP